MSEHDPPKTGLEHDDPAIGPEHDTAYKKCETGEFKRVDLRTRDRVSSFQGRWEGALKHMWIAIIGLYICMAGVGVGAYVLYKQIQDSRIDATFQTCQESNDRHDRTVTAFKVEFKSAADRLRARGELTPDRRQQLAQSRASNLRLINVFIPVHKDSAGRSTCREFARGRVSVDG